MNNPLELWREYDIIRLGTYMLIMNCVWYKFIANSFYLQQLDLINNKPTTYRNWSMVLVYMIMLLGLNKLVLPLLNPNATFIEVWKIVRIYSLLVYGVLNLTNHAIIDGWSWQLTIVDLSWGMFMSTLSVWLTLRTSKSSHEE
jgi:uncharacterized membrane protein